ncbi:MAG: glutathione S-transferase family protein [Anderseniella sp.]
MYDIYTSPGTGSFAVEVMLEAGSAPWQRINIDTSKNEHKSPEYLKTNPTGQVPALRLDNTTTMTESAAICLYLGDAHPETKLAPAITDKARAQYLRWMVFLPAVIYEADLRVYYSDRYTSDPAGVAGVKQRALEQMDKAFAILDAHLETSAWLAGENMTAADIYMTMLASWHPDVTALKSACPAVAKVWDKVAALDYVQRTNEFHKLW